MKSYLLFILVFWSMICVTILNAQCEVPEAWTNNLQLSSYTYSIHWANLSLSMFPKESSFSTVQTNIRNNISSVLNSWGGAAGITFNNAGDESTADIYFVFADCSGKAGDATYSVPIYITFDTSVDFAFSSGDGYFIFKTVAFHEVGRIFHGTDHPNYSDTNSATIETWPDRVITSISSCDSYAMDSLYRYTVSYNNEFESGMTGDTMNVNGTIINLPSEGGQSKWHKNDQTKTLTAVDQWDLQHD